MSLRMIAIGFAIVCTCGTRDFALAGPLATPASASPSPNPCTTALPDLPNDLTSAFAYDLGNAAMLRFISMLANVPQSRQKELFDKVVKAGASPGQSDLTGALANDCANLDALYGQTRALILVTNKWTLAEREDDQRFNVFLGVLSNELSALSPETKLTAEQQATAAAPFALPASLPQNTPSPLPGPTASDETPCTSNAKVANAVQPQFPPIAAAMRLSGTVQVKVTLNTAGDVESARLYHDTLQDADGSDDMIRQSIYSAAASTYIPARRDCAPISGSYLFTSQFKFGR